MKYQKIINWLDNTSNQPSRFRRHQKHLKVFGNITEMSQLDYLIDPSFQEVNRLFVLSLENDLVRISIILRKNIVWKLACTYCLCYCKTFR